MNEKYADMKDAVAAIEPIVKLLRQYPEAELEARLGTIKSDRFSAGVDRGTIDRIIDMMIASPHVKGDEDWKEEQDFFFEQNGSHLRTRVTYDNSTLTIHPSTIKKTNIATKNIKVFGSNNIDIRVSLKQETEVVHVDPCVNTTLVRIKQHRRFVTDSETWAFDFAMTWSGKTKTEAEESQSCKDPEFEVECELIDTKKELAVRSDRYIALSLLLKMKDLLSGEKFAFVPDG